MKRKLMFVFLGVCLFAAGWAIGNGRLSFGQLSSIRSNKDLPGNLNYNGVEKLYTELVKNYDGKIEYDSLNTGLKKGLVDSLGDPYTQFFSAKEASEFRDSLDGKFEGIGAELGKDVNNNLIVVAPLDGSPASEAGLRAKDIITKIDGNDAGQLTVSEAVSKIRGVKGSTVTLTIYRQTEGKELDIAIIRQTIDLPSVKSEMKDKTCIIKIRQFSDDTNDLARDAANGCVKNNATAVVLDLRSNPGGLVDAAVGVSSLWLDKDQTVLTERRGGEIKETLKATGSPVLGSLKTVVLIDSGSASASEIVAGALKDNSKATLVGQKSYGKGSVQTTIKLLNDEMVKITIARWYTPSGKNIDKEGISPDVSVNMSEDDYKTGNDSQLDKALEELKK